MSPWKAVSLWSCWHCKQGHSFFSCPFLGICSWPIDEYWVQCPQTMWTLPSLWYISAKTQTDCKQGKADFVYHLEIKRSTVSPPSRKAEIYSYWFKQKGRRSKRGEMNTLFYSNPGVTQQAFCFWYLYFLLYRKHHTISVHKFFLYASKESLWSMNSMWITVSQIPDFGLIKCWF